MADTLWFGTYKEQPYDDVRPYGYLLDQSNQMECNVCHWDGLESELSGEECPNCGAANFRILNE